MERSSLIVLCVLLSCSVWMVQGKYVAIDDQQDRNEQEDSAELQIKGICKACKWALNKVKKIAGNNETVAKLKSNLLKVCDQFKPFQSKCQKFVEKHLEFLVKELTTTDDVRTICVKAKACKPKELLIEEHYPEYTEELSSGSYMEE